MTSSGSSAYARTVEVMLHSVSCGEQIDHYLLEKLIATGASATTYRATDLRTGRPVAIKIPHAEIRDHRLLYQRFRHEQEIGRQLNHPSLLRFVDG